MAFSLLQLEEAQLREIAESRVPAGLSQRTEQGALPPGFVAARALSLLSKGNGEFWSSTFLIVRNRDDRIVGACGFKHAPKAGRVEIGYGVSPACRGEGAATQAVKLLVGMAFAAGAEIVLAEVSPKNHASVRVAQKAGLVEVGSRIDEDDEYVVQWVARRDARPLA